MKNGAMLCTDLASRGLDIPDVNWIVQFDAPQVPDAFIHRVGRTARMGKEGNALLYLLPEEDSYIEYLKVKKVPISEMPLFTDVPHVIPKMKQIMKSDREVLDRAQVAYVSYIRAYKEHQLSYIFRIQKLDLGLLASGFGLLALPKMPELKNLTNINFVAESIDLNSIPYKDKLKEKQRLEKSKRIQDKKMKELNEPSEDSDSDLSDSEDDSDNNEQAKLKGKKENKKLAATANKNEEKEEEEDDFLDLYSKMFNKKANKRKGNSKEEDSDSESDLENFATKQPKKPKVAPVNKPARTEQPTKKTKPSFASKLQNIKRRSNKS